MIKIKGLKVNVDDKEILRGVSLEIKPGEVHAVMGKNGSGKSTLAYTLAGHPKYKIIKNEIATSPRRGGATRNDGGLFGAIEVDGKIIDEMAPNERAEMGIFLANQYPAGVPGLISTSFLWQIYKKRNINSHRDRHVAADTAPRDDDTIMKSIVQFRPWLEQQAKALDLNLELLGRGINDGFSGGEKKKMEILQMLVSNPKYLILDEIDSGLDVDALKKIATTVAQVAKTRNIGVLIITHYSRILKYIKVDRVHVMENGLIKESGGQTIIERIENSGFAVDPE